MRFPKHFISKYFFKNALHGDEWGAYKSAQIAALLVYCAQGATIEEPSFSIAVLPPLLRPGRRNRIRRNRSTFIQPGMNVDKKVR